MTNMKYQFLCDLGKYKNFPQLLVGKAIKEFLICVPILACAVIINYNIGDSLFRVIVNVLIGAFLISLPNAIRNILQYKTLIYELYFDGKYLNIVYNKFLRKKTILIPYNELSFAVKTVTYLTFPSETCVRIYSNHEPTLFFRSGGWDQGIVIEIIKVLLDVTNNTLETPLNKRKIFKKEYLYTMELKKSGVAKQLIAISNKMNK